MDKRLSQVELFNGLDAPILDELERVLEERRLEGGELLCSEGSVGHECFFVAEGMVTVSKLIDRDTGDEKVLSTLGPGDFFGEMALLEDIPRTASVRAAGPVRLLVLSRSRFQSLLDGRSDVAVRLLFGIIGTLVERLRRTSTELVALFDTGKLAGSVSALPELCAGILERVVESMECTMGLLLLKNAYTEKIELQNSLGYPAERIAAFDLSCRGGLLDYLFGRLNPFIFNDFRQPEGMPAHGFERSVMAGAPLVLDGRAIGAVVVAEPRVSGSSLDLNHLNLLLGVAMQVAAAIENARRKEEEQARERHSRHFVTF